MRPRGRDGRPGGEGQRDVNLACGCGGHSSFPPVLGWLWAQLDHSFTQFPLQLRVAVGHGFGLREGQYPFSSKMAKPSGPRGFFLPVSRTLPAGAAAVSQVQGRKHRPGPPEQEDKQIPVLREGLEGLLPPQASCFQSSGSVRKITHHLFKRLVSSFLIACS